MTVTNEQIQRVQRLIEARVRAAENLRRQARSEYDVHIVSDHLADADALRAVLDERQQQAREIEALAETANKLEADREYNAELCREKDARLAVLEAALRDLLRMAQAIWNELPLDKQARLYPDTVTFDPAIRAIAGQEPPRG
jgi:hypothetical protein